MVIVTFPLFSVLSSQFTVHSSQLTAHGSQLTIHHSPFTIHYSLVPRHSSHIRLPPHRPEDHHQANDGENEREQKRVLKNSVRKMSDISKDAHRTKDEKNRTLQKQSKGDQTDIQK